MVDIHSGYSLTDLLGALLPVSYRKPGVAPPSATYFPSYLRNYAGVFSEEGIEDYRLAKLVVLLEKPQTLIPDIEQRTGDFYASLNGNRRELTEKVYQEMYTLGVKLIWRISYGFSARKLEGLLREGEAEDLAEDITLRAINSVASYTPTKAFLSWYAAIARNAIITLLRTEVKRDHKRFSELLPEINSHAEQKIDLISERTGINFSLYVQDPVMAIVANEIIEKITKGWSLLPRDQKDALAYVMAKVDYQNIALLMRKSEGNVRVLVYRGRQSLLAYLDLIGVEIPRSYLGNEKSEAKNTLSEAVEEIYRLSKGLPSTRASRRRSILKISSFRLAGAVFRENYVGGFSRTQLAEHDQVLFHNLAENGLLDLVMPE